MPNRPVVLLTFANQQDAYLQKLKEESKLINEALSKLHDNQTIEVYREESATADTVYDALMRFKDRIAIYHYAGHASGSRVYFEDNSGGATGVATLLGQLPNLQLVFLNGCSTLAQVKRLFDAGVRAVIATAVPINDEKAVAFAERFYLALASGNNVESAFRSAVGYMQLKYGGDFNATVVRRGEMATFSDTAEMPWGLFLNNTAESENVQKWEIPVNISPKVVRPPEIEYQINCYMIDIMASMIDWDASLEKQAYNADGDLIDDREIFSLIIENFPWPIGVQIRLLATKDEGLDTPSVFRIKQIVSTYLVTLQFLFYIALSQLWDVKRNKAIATSKYINDLLFVSDSDFNTFDYLNKLIDILKLLQTTGNELFVKELADFIKEIENPNSELWSANEFLKKLRNHINNQDETSLETNKLQWSADGEFALSVFLGKLAFFVNYDLLTIRDIHVVNYRNLGLKFNHFMGRLNAKVNDLTVGRNPKPRAFEQFANNASVILTANAQNPATFLNLSPFIIDKNAFGVGMTEDKATEQQLYIYAHRDGEDYKYFTTIHNIYRCQERPTDQFSTAEGAIATGDGAASAEDARGNRLRDKLRSRLKRQSGTEAAANDEVENPYAVLKEQFKIFEKDFTV